MKTITVALDFSPVTFRQLEACRAFCREGARVQLLNVWHKTTSRFSKEVAYTDGFEPTERHRRMRLALSNLQTLLDDDPTITITLNELEHPRPAEGTLKAARDSDLLIVGSHGHGALYDLFVGSVTDEVIRTADIPVLVVPSDGPKPPETYGTILMGIDFEQDHQARLREVIGICRELKADLVLTHILSPMEALSDGLPPDANFSDNLVALHLETIQTRLDSLRDQATVELGRPVRTDTTVNFAEDGLVISARRKKADLIVLGRHPHMKLYEKLVGSVPVKTARISAKPVLVLPPVSVPADASA